IWDVADVRSVQSDRILDAAVRVGTYVGVGEGDIVPGADLEVGRVHAVEDDVVRGRTPLGRVEDGGEGQPDDPEPGGPVGQVAVDRDRRPGRRLEADVAAG